MKWKTFRENRQTKAYVAACVFKVLGRVNFSIVATKFSLYNFYTKFVHLTLANFPRKRCQIVPKSQQGFK